MSDEHYFTEEQINEIKILKQDTTDAGRETYQSYVIDALIGLHTEDEIPVPEPCPPGFKRDPVTGECIPEEEPTDPCEGITLPTDGGGPKPGGWGANNDATKWVAVQMKNNPNLWKVVDENGVNVAHNFTSQTSAQQYIDYYKCEQSKPIPECPEGEVWDPVQKKCVTKVEPQPGSSTTKDGVTVPFKVKGEWKYNFSKNARDGGARYNGPAAGTSFVMVGYFTGTSGSDDVSAKLLGGRHTDSAPYDGCCYDPSVSVDSGRVRMRCECPHPTYSRNLDLDFTQQGVSIHNRWVGFMAVALQEIEGVRIQIWQDQGDNSNAPANQWVKIMDHLNKGPISGLSGGNRFPIRELVSSAANTWRIDETPGLDAKWLAISEIDIS